MPERHPQGSRYCSPGHRSAHRTFLTMTTHLKLRARVSSRRGPSRPSPSDLTTSSNRAHPNRSTGGARSSELQAHFGHDAHTKARRLGVGPPFPLLQRAGLPSATPAPAPAVLLLIFPTYLSARVDHEGMIPHRNVSSLLLHLLHRSFQTCIAHIAPGSGDVADDIHLDTPLAHGSRSSCSSSKPQGMKEKSPVSPCSSLRRWLEVLVS